MINLTPFPIRLGSAQAKPIPSEGAPRVVHAPAAPTMLEVGAELIPVVGHTPPIAIEGLSVPVRGMTDIIIPLAVAEAMRTLGMRWFGRVYSPQMLVEAGGIRFAPGLVAHPDLSHTLGDVETGPLPGE